MLGSGLLFSVATALALGSVSMMIEEPAKPIKLVTETTDTGVALQVVGLSYDTYEADYVLEVMSGDTGGNRNRQSGSVRLQPNQRAILLTTKLGGVAGRRWFAILMVTPRDAPTYAIRRYGG